MPDVSCQMSRMSETDPPWRDIYLHCQDIGVHTVDATDLQEHNILIVDTWHLGTLLFFGVPTVHQVREAIRRVWLRSLN